LIAPFMPFPQCLPMRRFIIAVALLACSALSHAAPSDDARALLREGKPEEALHLLDEHLAASPEDTQTRFLKGVIQSERGDTDGAIETFRALIRDYPELAEPYNNLAVLYAGRGDYAAARDALEMAVRVKPDYATAYENLGDVHALLAMQAYEKAVALNQRSAEAKLAIARELTKQSASAP